MIFMEDFLQVAGVIAVGVMVLSTVLSVYYGNIGALIPFWVEFGIEHHMLTAIFLIAVALYGGTWGIETLS